MEGVAVSDGTPSRRPEVSVVVPSHDRPLRLLWLLNALERQTLPKDRWEVVVCHDSRGPETERLLKAHALAKQGILRYETLPPGSAPPGANRNVAWRMAHAPLIAFTDDDCRPPPEWLEQALDAANRHSGAIVQGKTQPDPDEMEIAIAAPYPRTQRIMPPVPWAQCCNILYPRDLLERANGFDETLMTGEDCDLAMRLRAEGVEYVGVPELLTFHAVEAGPLWQRLRGLWRWRHLPYTVKVHPELREHFPLWAFWRETHVWLPFALAALVLQRRSRLYGLMALPYLLHAMPSHGAGPRGRIRSLMEFPGRLAIDVTEFTALAWGSIKNRTFFV